MKRKTLNLLIAGVIALSAVGGLAGLMAGGPALKEKAQAQFDTTPVLIAGAPIRVSEPAPGPTPQPAPGGATTDGNSWGG